MRGVEKNEAESKDRNLVRCIRLE